MSEDRAPYTVSSNNEMADFQAAVERQQFYLEIEKIHALPDDCSVCGRLGKDQGSRCTYGIWRCGRLD